VLKSRLGRDFSRYRQARTVWCRGSVTCRPTVGHRRPCVCFELRRVLGSHARRDPHTNGRHHLPSENV